MSTDYIEVTVRMIRVKNLTKNAQQIGEANTQHFPCETLSYPTLSRSVLEQVVTVRTNEIAMQEDTDLDPSSEEQPDDT